MSSEEYKHQGSSVSILPLYIWPVSSLLQLRGFLSQVRSLDSVILSGFFFFQSNISQICVGLTSLSVKNCTFLQHLVTVASGNAGVP